VTAFDILSSTSKLSSLPAVWRALSWQLKRPPGCTTAWGTSSCFF